MMTILLRSQTLASLPNSRLKTPMVPGPQTSWVISTSVWTQTLSPACARDLPAARARIFSVSVILVLQEIPGCRRDSQISTLPGVGRRVGLGCIMFPLTSTLSLREREDRCQSVGELGIVETFK